MLHWATATPRDLTVHVAKQAAEEGRYSDVLKGIKKVVLMHPEPLTFWDAILLEKGFTNVIASERSFRRILLSIERKESTNVEWIKRYIRDLEKNIRLVCTDIKSLLENYVMNRTPDKKAKEHCIVLYNMILGDSLRYRAELKRDNDQRKELAKQALVAYEAATKVVDEDNTFDSVLAMKLSLNFSVFYYEIINSLESGNAIARKSVRRAKLDDAFDAVDIKIYSKCIQIRDILYENYLVAGQNVDRKARGEEVVQLKDALHII